LEQCEGSVIVLSFHAVASQMAVPPVKKKVQVKSNTLIAYNPTSAQND
uniref:Transposase n=1 Tax=Anisakis simplex TaxID=6269 RepID=A0A0M3JK91_ANISI